jgi:hypothetical protein
MSNLSAGEYDFSFGVDWEVDRLLEARALTVDRIRGRGFDTSEQDLPAAPGLAPGERCWFSG